MIHAVILAALLSLAGCQDSDNAGAAGRGQLVESARVHVQRMREAEATIRSLNDPRTRAGRKRIGEAVALRKEAEAMLRTTEVIAAKEAAEERR